MECFRMFWNVKYSRINWINWQWISGRFFIRTNFKVNVKMSQDLFIKVNKIVASQSKRKSTIQIENMLYVVVIWIWCVRNAYNGNNNNKKSMQHKRLATSIGFRVKIFHFTMTTVNWWMRVLPQSLVTVIAWHFAFNVNYFINNVSTCICVFAF